ncbi:MAG: Spy/CpxP family protein refolding chaperone [Bacteroidetes bacterium]|nr:Spy/CpxP family protein refolding chaperone [Bacteroidota bacterium]
MNTIKKNRVAGLSLIVLLLITNVLLAQRTDSVRTMRSHKTFQSRSGNGMHVIPNLTDDQKAKIKAQRVAFGKETLPLTNQLAEKRAHLRTLQTAATVDVNAVNATIDDIAKTQSQLMKRQAANYEAIRKLLTDEQRLAFDLRKGFGRGNGKGHDRMRQGHRN